MESEKPRKVWTQTELGEFEPTLQEIINDSKTYRHEDNRCKCESCAFARWMADGRSVVAYCKVFSRVTACTVLSGRSVEFDGWVNQPRHCAEWKNWKFPA